MHHFVYSIQLDDGSQIGDEDLSKKFETVHNHLDYVDRTLAEISKDIEEIIHSEFIEIPLGIDYDIDEGTIQAQISINKVANRVNQHLEPPFFVEVDENKIVVNDVIKLLVYSGLERPEAEHELKKMKQKGEIYELNSGCIRTT